nr:transposase [Xanthomonas citri]
MACERFAVRVHAFVLMDNHVHLLVSIRLERCLRRCGSAANRMCRPSRQKGMR